MPPWRQPIYLRIDRFGDFEEARWVSPNGRRYVVISDSGGERHAVLCERGVDRASIDECVIYMPAVFAVDAQPPLRDPADRCLCDVPLPGVDPEILVSDTFDGFLVLGVGNTASASPWRVRWIDSNGTVVFEYPLDSLFGPTRNWHNNLREEVRGMWLDEGAREAVLVSTADPWCTSAVRVLSLPDGAVREGCSAAERLRWAMHGSEAARCLAIELIAESGADECRAATAMLVDTCFDRSESMALRLRCGVVLARGGHRDEVAAMFRDAIAPVEPTQGEQRNAVWCADRSFALRHLPDVLGDEAKATLLAELRSADKWQDDSVALDGCLALGAAIVPDLRALLRDASAGALPRRRAVHLLHALCDPDALPELRACATDGDEELARAAHEAIDRIIASQASAR